MAPSNAVALALLCVANVQAHWTKVKPVIEGEGVKSALGRARVSPVDLARGLPYSFKEYIEDFSKPYDHHDKIKKAVFEANLEQIRRHNAANKYSKMTVNENTDLTKEEFHKRIKGFKHMAVNLRGIKKLNALTNQCQPPAPVEMPEYPESLDWRTKNVLNPVEDQGDCGSCWAFSTTETVEAHLAIATKSPPQKLSIQQIVSCAPNPNHCGGDGGCDGSTQSLAFEYLTNSSGLVARDTYPYTSKTEECNIANETPAVATISGYANLAPNNYAELMKAIQIGPVSISVAASSWMMYSSGIWNETDWDIDHAVQLVGYGVGTAEEGHTPYWIVRNSWSDKWGEDGYIRLQRYPDQNPPCAMDMTPEDGSACDGDHTPVCVCGTSGILSESSYPLGVSLAQTTEESDTNNGEQDAGSVPMHVSRRSIVVATTVTIAVFVMLGTVGYCCCCTKKSRGQSQDYAALVREEEDVNVFES